MFEYVILDLVKIIPWLSLCSSCRFRGSLIRNNYRRNTASFDWGVESCLFFLTSISVTIEINMPRPYLTSQRSERKAGAKIEQRQAIENVSINQAPVPISTLHPQALVVTNIICKYSHSLLDTCVQWHGSCWLRPPRRRHLHRPQSRHPG